MPLAVHRRFAYRRHPMIRGVAIETSGRVGSVATVLDGRVLDERAFPHGLQHAAGLLPLVDRMCRAEGWGPQAVDELYVSAGPGSFTGLRIGVTLAKTLALATGVRLVAVPTVDVLAANAPPIARSLIIVLDAKRGQIYTARFTRPAADAPWSTVEPAHLDVLTDVLARAPRPVHLLGDGIPYHREHVPADDTTVVVTAEDDWRPRAAAVADRGYGLARRDAFADPFRLTPVYLRKPEAEEKWERAHGG